MNNRIIKIRITRFCVISGVILCSLFFTVLSPTNDSFANTKENWNNTVTKKALLAGARWCYVSGAMLTPIDNLSNVFDKDFTFLLTEDGKKNDVYVALPTGITNIVDNNISCKGLFTGDKANSLGSDGGSFEGLFSLSGNTEYTKKFPNKDTNKASSLVEGLGYSAVVSENGKRCISYHYIPSSGKGEGYNTPQICYNGLGLSIEKNGDRMPYFEIVSSTDRETVFDDGVYHKNGGFTVRISQARSGPEGGEDVRFVDYYPEGYHGQSEDELWNSFVEKLDSAVSSTFHYTHDGSYKYKPDYNNDNQNTHGDSPYELTDQEMIYPRKILTLLSSYDEYQDIVFTKKEKLQYYMYTLQNYFYEDIETGTYLECNIEDPNKNSGYYMIHIDISSNPVKRSSKCGVDYEIITEDKFAYGFAKSGSRGGIMSDGIFDASGDTKLYLKDVITEINNLVDGMTDEELADITVDVSSNDNADNSSDDTEAEITCANSGGAESLGWIVCPILEWMGNAANDVYNNYVAPSLEIEPQLFSQNPDEGTRDAWGVFQSLANICFIILVLIVIFSQLTGVGIDNYGIKKILPKLIVTAVLVNLSYLICLICVDLSNILGNALQALFDGLSTGTPTLNIPDSNANLGSAGTTVLTGVAVLAALVVMVGAVWKNPAILLSLLVAALGIVIAIFFLFILLSARQAAIIVLTVVSPIAFVSYILPNTKKLFDKWLKFWEGLLLVYPICGLLIGGGDYVSRLLLSAGFAKGGFISAFTAMIVGVLPIFFIPAVLKGAFAAMGAIGSRITGFGDRMRGGATRGLRNSEGYKNMQERGRETGIRRRAGYDKNGNRRWGENGPSRLQRFVRGGRRNIQRNALAYQKLKSEKGSLEATDGSDYMLATETANEAKRIVANGEINDNAGMQYSLYNALMANDRAKIRAYTDALSSKGEDGRQAVKAAYNQAVGAGLGRTEAGRNAAQTFANNILVNHGADYKNNNRSMFETAKNINQTQGQAVTDTNSYLSTAENRAKLSGKVTATTIGNMDDDAFGEIFGGYNGSAVSIPTGADAKEIGAAAYAALSSQNANIKAERRSYLEQIVKASGYTPETQNVNVTSMSPSINAQEGQVLNVRDLSDDTLLDIATNPNSSDNDPNRMAAEIEWRRRNPNE